MSSPTRPLAAVALAIGLAAAGGCRTQVVIDSVPRGAIVEIEGQRGVTPFTAALPVTTFSHYRARIEKAGFRAVELDLERDMNTTGAALGILCPPIWLGALYRATALTTVTLEADPDFPEALAHERPWQPDLPPLSPAMSGPVKTIRK
ncbi:MAG: PEGA domain-containing protein [Planctomycetes bacterium]|nr:PEGA domain-containing protein [Planctomycetota bacterium]